ncbi:alpha-amylase family glycosyl hydrolase [Falsiroseomonas sp. HW251]|uniref:alpha-amylase family glycosyl hydrolase n=1 Tax=Falsiroseomonas sp. HW251 TaxID=3390998 RepID=UPI003D3241DA
MGQDKAAPWWQGAVIYQLYPRSFRDSNGDGIGDLRGILEGLDHVASLGVDAVWLCPVYASPGADLGYDVADHMAVAAEYGTLQDLDALIAACHGRGLRVLLDLIVGHTSEAHPWFLESRAGREGPLAGRYVWADPKADGSPPNNWLSVFGGPAWRWEPARRQFALHHFLPQQPALNLADPATMDAMAEVMRFWLARGADGFRVDALDFVAHDPLLRSNPAAGLRETPAKLFGMQQHLHDMMGEATDAVLARLRAEADAFPNRALLGEFSSQPGAFQRIARATGPGRLHMAYTLAPLRVGFGVAAARGLIEAAAHPEGWPCWSFSNHDVVRTASRWAPEGGPDPRTTRMLLALLLTLRGSVSLYQGEELGLTQVDIPSHAIRDRAGRDGSRTPIPWRHDAPHGGFTTGTPWLPVPDPHRGLAVDRQEADVASPLRFTRAMLALRRANPALRRGALEPLELAAPLVGFDRVTEAARLRCVFNLSGEAAPIPATLAAPAIPGAPVPGIGESLAAWSAAMGQAG